MNYNKGLQPRLFCVCVVHTPRLVGRPAASTGLEYVYYVVTASSEGGQSTASLELRVMPRAPALRGYVPASLSAVVGVESVSVVNNTGGGGTFTVALVDNADGLSDLPPERQKLYNPQRNSKIYSKILESSRRIDAEELFWSAGLNMP